MTLFITFIASHLAYILYLNGRIFVYILTFFLIVTLTRLCCIDSSIWGKLFALIKPTLITLFFLILTVFLRGFQVIKELLDC